MSAPGVRAPFPIPVVAIGPGSQPEAEQADFLPMPAAMDSFVMPVADLEAEPAVVGACCALLGRLCAAMRSWRPGQRGLAQVDLHGVPATVTALVDQSLGHGEVSIRLDEADHWRVQESVFTGIWREQRQAADGRLVADRIIAAPIPPAVRAQAEAAAGPAVAAPPLPAGVMNAPALLTELVDRAGRWRDGDAGHVVNLSLLPVTPEDIAWLACALDVGPVTVLSRGYGNCRITATRLRHVWWVHYFNSMNQLILNTLEVAGVPEVACAAAEDLADSAERLEEWLASLHEALD